MYTEVEECLGHDPPELLQVGEGMRRLDFLASDVLLRPEWVLIGAALVLQYHAMIFWKGCSLCGKYGGRSGSTWLRTVGRQLMILQFYFCRSPWVALPRENPVRWSMGVVICDVYFMEWCAHALRWLQGGASSFWQEMDYNKVARQKVIRSAYMDFSQSLADISLLVFCQGSLFIMFYLVINTDEETHEDCNGSMLQWIVSVSVVLESGLDEVGNPYQPGHWLASREALAQAGTKLTPIAWWLRRSFDFLVNSLFREMLLGVIPVLLCVVPPLDMVKDALAILFICNMGQLDTPMSIEEMLEKRREPQLDYFDTED